MPVLCSSLVPPPPAPFWLITAGNHMKGSPLKVSGGGGGGRVITHLVEGTCVWIVVCYSSPNVNSLRPESLVFIAAEHHLLCSGDRHGKSSRKIVLKSVGIHSQACSPFSTPPLPTGSMNCQAWRSLAAAVREDVGRYKTTWFPKLWNQSSTKTKQDSSPPKGNSWVFWFC